MTPHPEELSRRISQIDLTSMQTKDTLPEYGPRYSKDELIKLRSETHDGQVDSPVLMYEGVKTPASPLTVPVPPSTPVDKLNGDGGQAGHGGGNGDGGLTIAAGEAEKKKTKGRGASKVATGFEGLCPLYPFKDQC